MDELEYMKQLAGVGKYAVDTSLPDCFTNVTPRSLNARKNAAEAQRAKMATQEAAPPQVRPKQKPSNTWGWLGKTVVSRK